MDHTFGNWFGSRPVSWTTVLIGRLVTDQTAGGSLDVKARRVPRARGAGAEYMRCLVRFARQQMHSTSEQGIVTSMRVCLYVCPKRTYH